MVIIYLDFCFVLEGVFLRYVYVEVLGILCFFYEKFSEEVCNFLAVKEIGKLNFRWVSFFFFINCMVNWKANLVVFFILFNLVCVYGKFVLGLILC